MAAINRTLGALVLYGAFTAALLLSQPAQAAPEPVQTEIGAIIQGRLEEGDSRLSAGQYADAYTFAGTAGEEVLLNLASSDFDGFLWLLNSAGEVIAIDDDTGDALSALISKFTLPGNDTYTVHVSSYHADEIGDYSLTLNEVPQIDYAEPLVLGDRIRGRLGYEDAQFSTGQFFDAYTFEARHGQAVSITMRSNRLDTYLWLLDEKGRVMTVNDDRKGGKKKRPVSQIIFFPPVSGTYTILASSNEPELEGGYELLLNTTARPVRAERLAGTVSGELSAADFQLSTGQYLDVYAFDGEKGESISLGLSSSGFDSYLRILDSDGNVVQHDDDSGSGKDALIQNFFLPETGRYYVWASSIFGGSEGEYVLSFNDSAMEMRSLSMDTVAEADTKEGLNISLRNKGDSVVSGGMSGGFELAAAQVDKPFTNPDRCKGSTSSYPAKVEICIGDRDEALSGTVSVSGPSGIVISPGSMSFTVNPNSCVTKSTFSITSASASAGVKSITATVPDLGSDSEDLNVIWITFDNFNNTGPTPSDSSVSPSPVAYGATTGTKNGMLLRATVTPSALTGVSFDIKRTKERATWSKSGGTWQQDTHVGPGADDDSHNGDEDLTLSAAGHIYVFDTPGFNSSTAFADEAVYKASFIEYVNIKVGSGAWVKCSDDYSWHSVTWLEDNGSGTWQRKGSATNEITTGSIPVGTSSNP